MFYVIFYIDLILIKLDVIKKNKNWCIKIVIEFGWCIVSFF